VTGDLMTGDGVDDAVRGVKTIIHCAGSSKGDEIATKNLVVAAARAGRPHIIHISVVGAERIPVSSRLDRMMFGYFEMKKKAEDVVAASGLPWTTIRATQFYDLTFMVAGFLTKLPIVPAPSGMSFQPVEADEVAELVVERALQPPTGSPEDIAGPRVYSTAALIRSYLTAMHKRRLLVPLGLPGKAARAVRQGGALSPEHAIGKRTWEDYLSNKAAEAARVQ